MFLFPLLMVEKKRQTMLSEIRKELEMNQKITTVNNLSYFIKEELKYYCLLYTSGYSLSKVESGLSG